MSTVSLGLDIGGANLKAATSDKRCASVPFPLWKQPDKLPAALAELVARFPDAEEVAVTMTGELCDCYATKREGVAAIVNAAYGACRGRPLRVWGTDGRFHTGDEAKANPLTVAAANWHALATFAGGYVPQGVGLLIDVGSTTTDIIPILDGRPDAVGKTDMARLKSGELVYTGVRRTPVMALQLPGAVAAEFFATVHDAYLLLELAPDDLLDCDTADGRPATQKYAHARMARMLGGDPELTPADETLRLAQAVADRQLALIEREVDMKWQAVRNTLQESLGHTTFVVTAGSGEWLARRVANPGPKRPNRHISLTEQLGHELSACAPAYAVAVLAAERPL